jgi:hypothetical protein
MQGCGKQKTHPKIVLAGLPDQEPGHRFPWRPILPKQVHAPEAQRFTHTPKGKENRAEREAERKRCLGYHFVLGVDQAH